MARKRYNAEETIHKLREADVLRSQGGTRPSCPLPSVHATTQTCLTSASMGHTEGF